MSEIVSQFYTNTYYTFASPRYNCIKNFPTTLVPEDYSRFDGINGTCDKFFPCYSLLENNRPKTELVNNAGDVFEQKGVFGFREHKRKFQSRFIGSKNSTNAYANKTLSKHRVDEDKYVSTTLNPGWCVIQTAVKPPKTPTEKVTYIPQFVVRALGNNDSIRQLYAVNLDDESNQLYSSNTDFAEGEIVNFKNNLFKCVKSTKEYPPTELKDNDFWQYINFDRNVFNADLFVLTDTDSKYFLPVSDNKRNFDPKREVDDTLLCWSVAYYHS